MMTDPRYWEESARRLSVAGRTAEAEQDTFIAMVCRTMEAAPFHRRAFAWFARPAASTHAIPEPPR